MHNRKKENQEDMSTTGDGDEYPVQQDPVVYIVATPIGNLKDITLRAIEILKEVDVIYCEDTRVTRRLVNEYGLCRDLQSYHEHNAARQLNAIKNHLEAGKSLALVSDAGTPLISDPGFRLVNLAQSMDVRVIPVPGASSPVTALSVSGLPSDEFYFCGFLPVKQGQRKKKLEQLKTLRTSLIFFESAQRLSKTLESLLAVFDHDLPIVMAREMTKYYEDIQRGTLQELHQRMDQTNVKGEIVLILDTRGQDKDICDTDIEEALKRALDTMSRKEAIAETARRFDRKKSDIYDMALRFKNEDDQEDEKHKG